MYKNQNRIFCFKFFCQLIGKVELFDFNKLNKGPFVQESFPVNGEIWTDISFSQDNRFILISTNGSYLKLLSSFDAKQIDVDLSGHLPSNTHKPPIKGAFLEGKRFVTVKCVYV